MKLLLLFLAGTVGCSVRTERPAVSDADVQYSALRPDLAEILESSQKAFRAGQFEQASFLFQKGYETASAAGNRRLAMRFLSNLGAARLAQHNTREALRILLRALELAQTAREGGVAGALEFNISSLYTGLGDRESAVRYAELALRDLRGEERRRHLPKLLIHLGTLRAQQGRMAEAVELFGKGMEGAEAAGDVELYAAGCSRLGEAYLARQDLHQAEPPLLEAFRIRKLNRLPALESSYRDLGQLRLAQRDFRSASVLLDRAVEGAARPGSPLPTWDLYQARGRALLEVGRTGEAMTDLRKAVELLRAWRRAIPPADRTRISVETMLQQIYSALVRAGNQLYFASGDPALARETFEAAEENRAASLRALLSEQGEAEEIPGLLEKTRKGLGAEQVYLSFHLGEPESYAWAVSREGVLLRRLPGRDTIVPRVGRFRRAVESGAPEAETQGEELFETLFGPLEPRVRGKKQWLLALDEHLFTLPFAALVTGRKGGEPVYLGTRQALQIASGAGLLALGTRRRFDGRFLGIGDPIYNRADVRWRSRRAVQAADDLGLVRLPGSAREIEACSRAWSSEQGPVLLTGASASRRMLEEALRLQPAVVHFATHVLDTGERQHGSIALSLGDSGRPELLGPAEIGGWQTRAGLVVLSGCSSGVAEALPGSGLMGLTRAWLAAGAAGVVASAWPTPDDSGFFFVSVYRHLREAPGAGPAAALQRARAEMVDSHTWRSQPRYWGSYFLMAND